MSGESRGWNGAGIGVGIESGFGTSVAAGNWLKVEKENLKENKVPRRRRSIHPVATAAAQAAHPQVARYFGMNIPGGTITLEGVYEGLDRLFYHFFGAPSQSDDGNAAYTHTYPNAVDLPAHPGLTLIADRDTTSLTLAGAFIQSMQFTVVPEEAMQIIATVASQKSAFSGAGVSPSFPSEEYFIEDYQTKLQVSVNEGAYADLEFDGFQLTYGKNLRMVPAHDGATAGVRQPTRAGYPAIAGQFARLYQSTTYYDEYAALDNIGLKLVCAATAIAGTGSTVYGFSIEMKACIIQGTGPETDDEGPRVETIDFEADTNSTNPAVIVVTTNEVDTSAF